MAIIKRSLLFIAQQLQLISTTQKVVEQEQIHKQKQRKQKETDQQNKQKQQLEKKEQAQKKAQQQKLQRQAQKTTQKLEKKRREEQHLRNKIKTSIHNAEKQNKKPISLEKEVLEKTLLFTPVAHVVGMKKLTDLSKEGLNQVNHAAYKKTNIQKGLEKSKDIQHQAEKASSQDLDDMNQELKELKNLSSDINDRLYRLDDTTRRHIVERAKHMQLTNVPQGDIHHWVEQQCKNFERRPIKQQPQPTQTPEPEIELPSLIRNKPKS